MKTRSLAFTSILLVLAIGSCIRITSGGHVRAVEFLSISAVGMLTGVLIVQLFMMLKKQKV